MAINAGDILTYDGTKWVNQPWVQGPFGIGVASPTALLHLEAGAAAANSAPLKFNSGTNLTTPEAGAVEFDGARLSFTAGASSGTSTRRGVSLSSNHLITTGFVQASQHGSTETTLYTGTIAPGEMAVGKTFAARLLGRYTTNGTGSSDIFTLRFKIGAGGGIQTIFTIIGAAKLIASPTPLDLEFIFTCRIIGASGAVRADVAATLDHVNVSQATQGDTAVDTTQAQTVTVTGQWGAGAMSANDALYINQGFLRVLN